MGKRGPVAKKGPPTAIRFEPALKQRLEVRARAEGRTFSDEVTDRLAQSFVTEGQDARITMTDSLCEAIRGVVWQVEGNTGRAWHEDPWTFAEVASGIRELLQYLRPLGEVVIHTDAPVIQSFRQFGHGELADQIVAREAKTEVGRFAANFVVSSYEKGPSDGVSTTPERKAALELFKEQIERAGTAGQAAADVEEQLP